MKKRIFIIHGWGGHPDKGWKDWLASELERRNFEIHKPQMPNAEAPKIEEWIPFLQSLIKEPDKNTFLVGHSMGCQAILRCVEKMDKKIGGIILVAGFTEAITGLEDDDWPVARPWLETPIDFEKIKSNCKDIVAIFSDNDKYVPPENINAMEKKLGARVIIEHNKGHFSWEDRTETLPSALDSILEMTK